jgi:hypothetical protein
MDTIDRLFVFGKELIPNKASYEGYCEAVDKASGNHHITVDMELKDKKVAVANRVSDLVRDNVIAHEFGTEMINFIKRCTDEEFLNHCCA